MYNKRGMSIDNYIDYVLISKRELKVRNETQNRVFKKLTAVSRTIFSHYSI